LTLRADGSFVYTPFATFQGSDTFRYQGGDGSALSNVATVALRVNALPGTPGKITGGGSVDSGVRTFGFVAQTKVQGGVLTFTGNLEFQDKAKGYNFHATAITLVRVEKGSPVGGWCSGAATVRERPGRRRPHSLLTSRATAVRISAALSSVSSPGRKAKFATTFCLTNSKAVTSASRLRR
jgi:Bacterial Ig domain